MKFPRWSNALILGFLFLGMYSCQRDEIPEEVQAAEYTAEVPLQWYSLFELIDRHAPGYRPPAAARALGYIGLAGYEAAVPGMSGYKSLGNHYFGLTLPSPVEGSEYHWPTSVNAAYNIMIQRFYPHIEPYHQSRVIELNNNFESEFSSKLSPAVFRRSKVFGEEVAKAVYEWSTTDRAGHEAYLNPRPESYTPPVAPGLWAPTPPNFSRALFPYWGTVRTFSLSNAELLSDPPLSWSEDESSQFYQQAKEVEVWVNTIKEGKDEEGYWIAEFWSDDFAGVTFTPAGRWIAIGNQLVRDEKIDLETAVRLYAMIGMALSDAGVAVWFSKYTYNLERPIDFINRNFDTSWETLMNHPITGVTGFSPEFPAYPSGHSGFGGAAAIILEDIFGSNYAMTDRCHESRTEFRGAPRSFTSFRQMAEENAYSRIPLGVHYRMDCKVGIDQGYQAGQKVLSLPWQ